MKPVISKLIAFLCYWTGLDSLFYFINRRAKRIITFHNVIPEYLLPQGKRAGLIDSEESFRMKIRIIKNRFKIGTEINDPTTAAITFDDGFKNQSEIAGRILMEEGGLSAIVFVAGRMINNSDPSNALLVDRLLHWTQLAPNNTYALPCDCAVVKEFILTEDNRQQIWQDIIWPSFCKDSLSRGEYLWHALDSQCPLNQMLASCNPEYVRLRMTGITDIDIAELKEKGWIVGWHTVDHYPLSQLSEEEQIKEITTSPDYMKNVVFSFPYGELDSVNEVSVGIARSAGYPFAVSNISFQNDLMCRHFLPRMMLDGNFFQCQMELSGLKHFIKTGKRLPVV